ncbi:transposase family protein [Adlercreutzia sp. ZJ141]|uniref:transposase family protein n=1 Tax=Adlercreutzia sp. ZJ141 TaxID=2709406 RepID=UPI0013EDB39F|nr:transposase family protein [Adlercreutzia sp. ZJ141]
MNPQTKMLATIIAKSLNLGDEWTVVDVEMRDCNPDPDELHVYIERTPGYALRCPRCGVMHGVCDTRERTWRHLDIWQYKTYIHCKLPRLDCEGGPITAEVPWAAPDAKHFTA